MIYDISIYSIASLLEHFIQPAVEQQRCIQQSIKTRVSVLH